MIIELGVAVFISLGLGTYIGYSSGKQVNKSETIEKWPATDHASLLKLCGKMCGEDKLLKYNITYGTCECKNK